MTLPQDPAESQLRRWIKQGEHVQQDFKYRIPDSLKLARTVSAFANTEGGRLLIGIRDDGMICGVRSDEEIFMVYCAADRYCKPVPPVDYQTIAVAGKTVVIAHVHASDKKPVRAYDEEGRLRAYIRIADENIVASPVHVAMWRNLGSPSGKLIHIGMPERLIMDCLHDTPRADLGMIVKRTGIGRRRVTSILATLVACGVIVMDYSGHGFTFSLK